MDNESGCAGSGPREGTGEMVTHQCRGLLETCLGPLLHRYAASSILSPIRDAQLLNDDIAFFCPRRSLKMAQGVKFSTKHQRSCTRLGPEMRCGRWSFRRSRRCRSGERHGQKSVLRGFLTGEVASTSETNSGNFQSAAWSFNCFQLVTKQG